jgi:hypothetical protein
MLFFNLVVVGVALLWESVGASDSMTDEERHKYNAGRTLSIGYVSASI